LVERKADINLPEVEYIETSLALQTRLQKERQRRRQWTVFGLTAGMVIAIGLAVFAFYQRQNSLRQASIGLASQAQLELDGTSPERSVLLALEALNNYPYTSQAEKILGQIVREFRLRFILSGHSDTVQDVAWSPDGLWMATAGNDGTLRIWNAQTRVEVLKISAHPATFAFIGGVQQVAWSPDGAYIATAGIEGTAKVWDRLTGEEIVTFSGHTDKVWGVTWSPDGVWVASASKDGTARVWNALTGEEKFTLGGHRECVKMVAWSPDGKWIATAGDDGTARIWDATTGEERLRLSGHTNWVWSVAWSPDGTRLATASEDGTVRVWEASSGRELSDIRLPSPVWQVAWSPDGLQLATASSNGLAQVWDVSSGKEAFALQGRTPELVDIAWSPDGKSLATTGGDGFTVRIWDATPAIPVYSSDREGLAWNDWSPDGEHIATINYLDRTVVIWDPETGETQLVIQTGATDDLQDVWWSPDGTRLMTTSWDMLAKIWDANTGEQLLTFSGHVGEPQLKFQGGRDSLFGGGWSPDGSRIVTIGGYGWVRVWDARTGEEYLSFLATKDSVVGMLGFSPDGKHLATCASPEVLQIWDAETGAPILGGFVNNTENLSFGDSIEMCFSGYWSPDGHRLLTANYTGDRGATIWDARTGKKLVVFKEHTSGLTFSTWSPNGKRVATGDLSGVIKIWDAQTGAELLSYLVPGIMQFQLDWSPDGTRLVAANVSRTVEVHRVWQTTEDLVEYAKECCVIRQLTDAERQKFGLK
jgi:WD40 repeat protein